MEIIAHTEIEKWNTIVKSFPEWDIYYLCEYAISLMIHNDGVPILLYYDDGDEIVREEAKENFAERTK